MTFCRGIFKYPFKGLKEVQDAISNFILKIYSLFFSLF